MKLLIIAITLILSTSAFSQNNSIEKDTAYSVAYEKLKLLYLSQLDSEIYQKKKRTFHEFYQKLNFDGEKSEIVPNPIPWIKKNLDKTDFFSVTEAELKWETYLLLSEKEIKENAEYHEFLHESMRKYGSKIFSEVMMDIINNYRTKLDSLKY